MPAIQDPLSCQLSICTRMANSAWTISIFLEVHTPFPASSKRKASPPPVPGSRIFSSDFLMNPPFSCPPLGCPWVHPRSACSQSHPLPSPPNSPCRLCLKLPWPLACSPFCPEGSPGGDGTAWDNGRTSSVAPDLYPAPFPFPRQPVCVAARSSYWIEGIIHPCPPHLPLPWLPFVNPFWKPPGLRKAALFKFTLLSQEVHIQ